MEADIVIIGGGVTGTAIARELARFNLDIILIEKEADLACGTSKANSGIIHAGYNASQDTIKGKMNVKANPQFDKICEDLNVPFDRIGSLVVGFEQDDLNKLKEIKANGEKQGIKGLEILNKEEIMEIETNISQRAEYALYAPTAGIISPYELAIGYGDNAAINGVEIMLNTEVTGIITKEDRVEALKTNKGLIETDLVINAAGVFADKVASMGGEKMEIRPRKGEYHLFDKEYGGIVDHVLFPISTEKSKGILVTPTVHGNILIGPNSYYLNDKTDLSTTEKGMEEIMKGARKLIPELPSDGVITSFSGLRAAVPHEDFIIGFSDSVKGLINTAGIQSPGLSSTPAIADKVVELVSEFNSDEAEDFDLSYKDDFKENNPEYPHYDNHRNQPEEWQKYIEKNKDYGKVICRCETVTKGEIIDAIHRPVPARTVDTIKRRTRAGSGRCQGGFCGPRVVQILAEEMGVSPLEVTKRGGDSNILAAEAKRLIKDNFEDDEMIKNDDKIKNDFDGDKVGDSNEK